MNIIVTVEAPDGSTEFLDAMGCIQTREQAIADPLTCKDAIECQIIAEYAAKRHSARYDVFTRNLKWEEVTETRCSNAAK